MNDTVKADGAEMSRLANRVLGRAQDAVPAVDLSQAADAVSGTEFAEVLREAAQALSRAGGGASARLQNISTLVKTSATALTGQEAANAHRVAGAGGVSA